MTVNQARRLQAVARWHRRIALFVLLWLGLLAASGIFINHAHDWGLDRKSLWQPLQGWIYGVEPAPASLCDGIQLKEHECAGVFGRLELPRGALLLQPHSVQLVDAQGGVLEGLPVSQMGLVSLKAGKTVGGMVFLQGPDQVIVTDTDLLEFRRASTAELDSVQAYAWQKPVDAAVQISWERFFLDLHAARFLGSFSRIFNDLMAVMILLLVVSGFWLHRMKAKKP